MMWFRKPKVNARRKKDGELLELTYTVHDDLQAERKLLGIGTDRENERQKVRVALQEGLYDFLHRQARRRQIDPEQVAEYSVRHNLEKINQ